MPIARIKIYSNKIKMLALQIRNPNATYKSNLLSLDIRTKLDEKRRARALYQRTILPSHKKKKITIS
jgi:hypothetical protein